MEGLLPLCPSNVDRAGACRIRSSRDQDRGFPVDRGLTSDGVVPIRIEPDALGAAPRLDDAHARQHREADPLLATRARRSHWS